jgi:hypothetical protein
MIDLMIDKCISGKAVLEILPRNVRTILKRIDKQILLNLQFSGYCIALLPL